MVCDMRPAPAVCPMILRCRVEAQGADHLPEEACGGTVSALRRRGDQPARRQASAVAAGLWSCDSKTPAVPYRGIAVGGEIKITVVCY